MEHTPYTTPVPEAINASVPETINASPENAKFELGMLVATPGVIHAIGLKRTVPYIVMHMTGHWGDLDLEDQRTNDWSVENGSRILSEYHVQGEKFWIITERDRSVTTLLLPDEY